MKHLKTNEEFAQEVLRRGEAYKRKRRKTIMSATAGFVLIFACAAAFAANGSGALLKNNAAGNDDRVGDYCGDYSTQELDGQQEGAVNEAQKAEMSEESFATSIADTPESLGIPTNEGTDTEAMPPVYAEIYCYEDIYSYENDVESCTNINTPDTVNEISQLIEDAKANATDVDPDNTDYETKAEITYTIYISQDTEEIYTLFGNVLFHESAGMKYQLSQQQADELREELSTIMKGR